MEILRPDHDTPWSRENEVSLRDYLMVVQRAWRRILILAISVSLVAAIVVSVMTPIYQANVMIIFEPQAPKLTSIDEVYTSDIRDSEEYYKTQYEILKSRPLAEQVITTLNLVDHLDNDENDNLSGDINPHNSSTFPLGDWDWLTQTFGISSAEPRTEQPLERMHFAVKKYFENLKVSPVKNTQLVEIKFSSSDPELAAAVANSHADAYFQSILDAKLSITKSAEKWMLTRLDNLKSNLDEAEQSLQAFREKENLVDSEGLQHLPSLELNELTVNLVDAQQELSSTKNTYWQVAGWGRDSSGAIDSMPSIPEVLNDPLVQQFKNQLGVAKQKLKELAIRYGPLHPEMVVARENLKTVEDNLLRQVASVIQGIKKKYEVDIANENAILAAINITKNQYHELGWKTSELGALKREVEANRELYELFFKRIKETAEMGFAHSVNARIISPAIAPLEPVKPLKALTVTMAFAISLLVGLIVSFVRDAMDNSLRDIGNVELKLGYQLLGVVPLLKSGNSGGEHKLISKPFKEVQEHSFIEAMRSLHTGIVLSGKANKTLMVTSSLSHEGKSKMAINLAYSCSLLERVVLVECDLYHPILVNEFEIDADTQGLTELIEGKRCLDDCLIERENFHVITAGSHTSDSREILGSPQFKELLRSLASRFDRIILDCPPVLLVSDSELISTYTDMVIYVVRTGSTQISQIKNGLEKLARIKDQPIKIVVNGLDVPSAEKYSGYRNYYDDVYER
ncbi:polysaccharide biosynthesis tyrosine autokinase [Moritella sp. 24]|uniref:GumC family protein n=1 Tax=Moritella sp. 24 TaxID=2746230 RepID=UPI001BA54598|nr:polysaccharide biosynthesis tyrosine autokinase [Moritella sp. 24]QUM75748.1 polysaccharide biosynthesis tyrosine autokinase [Moritella sp. 24]